MEENIILKELFQKTEIKGPGAFFKTRLMAVSREVNLAKKREILWRYLACFSLAGCFYFLVEKQMNLNQINSGLASNQPHVIQLQFDKEDLLRVKNAEISLPEGMSFHSNKYPELKKLKSLKLPINIEVTGKSRLPFVVKSKSKKHQSIMVRLLDSDDHLVRERLLIAEFNE